jgi:hypothetical protein
MAAKLRFFPAKSASVIDVSMVTGTSPKVMADKLLLVMAGKLQNGVSLWLPTPETSRC